jgi:hypothetical protein
VTRTPTALAGALLALAGCAGGRGPGGVPLPRVFQAEQAAEALQGGGERYRVHQACARAATSVDGLIACMREANYAFLVRRPGYPEAECWALRDRDDPREPPPPHCFVQATPAAPPAE